MARREDTIDIVRWIGAVHDLRPSIFSWLAGAWLTVGFLARVGIPSINPEIKFVPRPLETLGVIGLCLPAALQASLLRDHASWLADVSPRPTARLRLVWLLATQVFGSLPAMLWVVMLPWGVPRLDALTLWFLVSSATTLSVVIVGRDFGILLPTGFIALFSIGGLIPFGMNIVYNVDLIHNLVLCTAVSFVLSAVWFARSGDRRPRGESNRI